MKLLCESQEIAIFLMLSHIFHVLTSGISIMSWVLILFSRLKLIAAIDTYISDFPIWNSAKLVSFHESQSKVSTNVK